MKYFNGGFGLQLKKFLSIALIISVIILLVPIGSFAQPQVDVDSKVLLLRPPERVLSEDQCAVILERIELLSSPTYKAGLEKPLRKTQDLVEQGEKDMEKAVEGAKEALQTALIELATFKTYEIFSGNRAIMKSRIVDLRKSGYYGPDAWRRMQLMDKFDKYSEKLETFYLSLDSMANKSGPNLTEKSQKALNDCKGLQDQAKALSREFITSGVPQDIVDLLSIISPQGALINSLNKIVINSLLAGGDYYIAKRNLESYNSELGGMMLRAGKPELELNGLNWKYNQYCIGKGLTPAPSPDESASTPAPSASTPPPPKPSSGSSIALPLTVGVVAAAVAIGAAAGGGGGGGGSSSGGGGGTCKDSCNAHDCNYYVNLFKCGQQISPGIGYAGGLIPKCCYNTNGCPSGTHFGSNDTQSSCGPWVICVCN